MKKNLFFAVAAGVTVTLLGAACFFWANLPGFMGQWIGEAGGGVIESPVQIGKVRFEAGPRLHIERIRVSLNTRRGPVAFTADSVSSIDPLAFFFQKKPIRFSFKNLRPEHSASRGIEGEFLFLGGNEPRFQLAADFDGMTLEDFRWLDPDNLDGASGKVGGHIRFRRTGDQAPFFEMTLDAPDPGGSLQAKFFDLFLPYLPASVQRKRVEKLAGRGERLVRFKTADLKVEMPEGDRMKVLLHILVLDYNLKLQLSMEVRTDSENALLKIARWMGVVEVKL